MSGNPAFLGGFHRQDAQLLVIGMGRADMIDLGLFKKCVFTARGHINKLIGDHKITGFHVKLQTADTTG
jgi:hypothetical protein